MTTEQIQRIVEHFDRNIDSYRAQGYKEAQLRKEFIDPFFEALGWDMVNRAGAVREAYAYDIFGLPPLHSIC